MSMRTVVCFLVVAVACSSARAQQATEGKVKLTLHKVEATQEERYVLFVCEATFDNGTGKALNVRTSFSSAFDGVRIAVFDADGKVLKMQPYTYHQSPQAPPGGVYSLGTGKTAKRLVFPVDLPKTATKLKVCLIGQLPGSELESLVWLTDLVNVEVK
jgi:hypothetical protein